MVKSMRVSLILPLICAVASFALTLAAIFLPFFVAVRDEAAAAASNANSIGGHNDKAEATLWEMRTWGPPQDGSDSKEVMLLRNSYFTCNEGKIRIQAAEGVAIAAVVVAVTNLIMSGFYIYASAVIRFPLAVYFMLGAVASATVFVLMLTWYSAGWCEAQPGLKEEVDMKWVFGSGWMLAAASCGCSVIGCMVTSIPW
ncbi:hypothetical protein DQ04_00201020 [Trypanosoma grayi]|uniref:hypothetical protein n=1 Tax=Trypanosoma grayi TaxID=71804 RepID=UPI0004F48383|nr:hypothetical protein DQ04_00201020 [Trypanosoma grayi]KEG15049.1 hypothetical protein DQ04_00201020 [Trypanosoma grayi]